MPQAMLVKDQASGDGCVFSRRGHPHLLHSGVASEAKQTGRDNLTALNRHPRYIKDPCVLTTQKYDAALASRLRVHR